MPLVRFEVKNEYGSGLQELHKEADREDPKAVLDGVTVAGLVGILRQLGDLAEFAAEVFHGLQEQVMTTSSRSHKLMVRVQDIEVALPPLEKAVLAQTSHLHFCYMAGSEWHPRIRKENNHFIYNDLPRFILDSYKECRDPPRLHMLDKFDTGGLGSCLKRYSDPTFFKRVSAISIDTNAERRKEKKARRSKSRRQQQKNGEFTCSASILSGSGRMQYYAPHDYYQPSPTQSQTVSYTDATFKSDLRDQSFDSRARSGFIERVFNSPTQLAKQDMKESSSSDLNLRNNDNHDPSYNDEIRFKYEDDQSLLQEKGVPDSSYVTWDEKTEIVEHESQNRDGDEASHMLQTDYCQNTQEFIDDTRNEDQANISFNNDKADPIIAGSQLDDIESETDNYMDALNTTDSESGIDFDYQTKREVEHYSTNFNSPGIEGKINEIVPHESDHHPSHFESHTEPIISLNKEMSIPDIVSSDRVSQGDSPLHISGVTSESDSLPFNVFSESIRDSPKSEALTSDFSSLGSKVPRPQDPASAKVVSNTPGEFSGTHSVNFWTNGGLLGLEPSKPPHFTVSNAACHSLESRSINNTTPSGLNAINDCFASRQLDETVGMSRKFSCSTPCHENQEDDSNNGGTSFRKLSKHLSSNHGKAGDSHHSKRFHQIQVLDLAGEFKMRSTHNNPLNDGVFGLGHGLLVNGFGRKPSVLHDRTNETSKFPKSGVFENNRGQHTTSNDIGNGYSPPLELMKISFRPLKGGVESSKLKLKFHDGSQIHELARDMFPSFQLVPEPTLPLNADVSDSDDDDSFCRSSPRSDACISYHSQSNSEQWESSETPRSRDQEIYGTLSRISSVESISSSHELDRKLNESILIDNTIKSPYAPNVVDSSHLVPLFDLLSFDAVKPSLAITSVPVESLVFSCPKEPAPPPPPLPPMQWRVLKSHSDVTVRKEDSVSDGPTDASDMKELQFAIRVDRPKTDSIKPLPVIASDVEQVQRRVLKSHSDVTEHKEDSVIDGPTHAFDMKELQSAMRVDRRKPDPIKNQPGIASDVEHVPLDVPFNQPKPEPIKNQQAMAFDMKQLHSAIPLEAFVSTPKSKQQDQQMLNRQRVTGQAAIGDRFDEKEDLLQQIRTKSFNLRRTPTEKSTVSPVPADVKVTAILEKAIAIRQAVGSDDSEVDTWSDA